MNEFQPKLVLVSRINDISDKVDVAVESSAAQSTYQSFPSTTASNSSINWNINIPSENVAVDRKIYINTDLTFTVKLENVPLGTATPFRWAYNDGLGQFPLNSLFSQVQASINNVSVSTPTEDIMAPLLRLCDQEEVSYHNQYTASYLDQNFDTALNFTTSSINPLAGGNNLNYNGIIQPRGVIVPTIEYYQTTDAGVFVSNSEVIATAGNILYVYVTVNITESIMFLSPFQGLVPSKNDAAMIGINNINIVANIRSNFSDLYKTASGDYTRSVSLGQRGTTTAFTQPKLLLNLLTLQPEQYSRINTRNVLPIQDYARFVSSYSGTVAAGATNTYTFPIIQLNQIPESLVIFIRPPLNSDPTDFKSLSNYLTINTASISFNNQSGILASCTKQELYDISKMNGSKQSYNDFTGKIMFDEVAIGSQGSILVLKPAYNFNLPSFLSAGSLGQFGLQITLGATNNHSSAYVNPDLVCIAVNSGIMVTQQGSSSLYSGLLTKNMVLEAKQQQPSMDSATFSSLTGGSIQEKCGSNLRKLLKKQYGSKGAGMSAGGMSAGGMSAGSAFGDKVGKYADTVSKMSKYI